MDKYKVDFKFDLENSLDEIFIRVLLKKIESLKKERNSVLLSCGNTSLSEGGINYKFREYE